jgi:hypothetical protein
VRGGTTLVCAVVLVAFAPVPAAHAGGPGDDLGSVAGINYRGKLSADFPVGGFDSFAGCVDDSVVIGGGGDIEGLGTQGRLRATYRSVNGFSPNSWRTALVNLSGGTKDMSFFAICKESGKRGLKYVTAKRKFEPGQRRSVKAKCPDGYRVLGGGIYSVDPIVTTTAPFDGKDDDSKPDDGWKATAVNNHALEQKLEAQAVCRKSGTWQLAYKSTGVGAAGNTTASAGVLCIEGTVVGGGASINGPKGDVRLQESYPKDSGGADTPDGWSAGLTNLGADQASGAVHAICKL